MLESVSPSPAPHSTKNPPVYIEHGFSLSLKCLVFKSAKQISQTLCCLTKHFVDQLKDLQVQDWREREKSNRLLSEDSEGNFDESFK